MTVNSITDTKKGRTGIAPTYLHTTRLILRLWRRLPVAADSRSSSKRFEVRSQLERKALDSIGSLKTELFEHSA